MNLLFSSSKTLKVEGLEILDKEAISIISKSSTEENVEEEGDDDSWVEGSWLRIGFTETKEVKDMVNGKKG